MLNTTIAIVLCTAPSVCISANYTLSTVSQIAGQNGYLMQGELYEYSNNFFVGTAARGGADNKGSIFGVIKLPGGNSTQFRWASFNGDNGAQPMGHLVSDGDGILYGITFEGGSDDNGTVYSFSPITQQITTLVSFNLIDGARPQAGLSIDADGNLYGTTANGANNLGTVFKVDAITHELTTLASFNGLNGGGPTASLLLAADGNLYGTTEVGGPLGHGTVFVINSLTHNLETLVMFNGANGEHPRGGLVADSFGNIYGTTQGKIGSTNFGSIFRLNIESHELTTLVSFDGANGKNPMGDLLIAPDGNLYGTTNMGGIYDKGTIFEFSTTTNSFKSLASFDGQNGQNPVAGLIADASGNLYGVTDNRVFKLSRSVPEVSPLLFSIFGLILFSYPYIKGLRRRTFSTTE